MLNATSRCVLLCLFVLALPVQPALAREHSVVFHHLYRHHHGYRDHGYRASAYRHRYAHHYARRRVYAERQMWDAPFAPFGMMQSGFADGAPTQDWRQPRTRYGMERQSTIERRSSVERRRAMGFSPFGQERNRISAYQEQSRSQNRSSGNYGGMAAQQASANGIPVSLVNRVIGRESGGNPRAVSRGNYGLMQIRLGTARAMGYSGSAAGLLDAATNMTYAVRYLAGAYRAAGGNENRAVALYARGYNAARVQTASRYTPNDASSAAAPMAFGYFGPRQVTRVADYRVDRYHLRHHHRHPA
jgi:soluble lytic murein transglycosylase-like protein